MAHIDGTIIIHRPVEKVFDFVADERNEPHYNPLTRYVEQTSAGPIGLGTTFCAETISWDRLVVMTTTLIEYARPYRLTSSTHLSTMDSARRLTFASVPEGTQMCWSWKLEPRGLLKLMTPVVAWIGGHQERATWTGLKQYLEARGTPLAADRGAKASRAQMSVIHLCHIAAEA
jgi:hypothetical protein